MAADLTEFFKEAFDEDGVAALLHKSPVKSRENCLPEPAEIAEYGGVFPCEKIIYEDGWYQINTAQFFDDFGVYRTVLHRQDGKIIFETNGGGWSLVRSEYHPNGNIKKQDSFSGPRHVRGFEKVYDTAGRLVLEREFDSQDAEEKRREFVYHKDGSKTETFFWTDRPDVKEITTYSAEGKILKQTFNGREVDPDARDVG